MRLSNSGRRFLKRLEGYSLKPMLKAYRDTKGVWTIGYGSTLIYEDLPNYKTDKRMRGVVEGDSITPAQAESLFDDMLVSFERAVESKAVGANQYEFDAWVCFAYNVGIGGNGKPGFATSTALKRWLLRDVDGAVDALLWWDKLCVNGSCRVLESLRRRRIAEGRLLRDGYYDPTPYGDPGKDEYTPVKTPNGAVVSPGSLENRPSITSSRTVKTAAVGGTAGTVATASAIMSSVKDGADSAKGIINAAGGGVNGVLMVALIVALGCIAYMAWCRYDDFRKGLR